MRVEVGEVGWSWLGLWLGGVLEGGVRGDVAEGVLMRTGREGFARCRPLLVGQRVGGAPSISVCFVRGDRVRRGSAYARTVLIVGGDGETLHVEVVAVGGLDLAPAVVAAGLLLVDPRTRSVGLVAGIVEDVRVAAFLQTRCCGLCEHGSVLIVVLLDVRGRCRLKHRRALTLRYRGGRRNRRALLMVLLEGRLFLCCLPPLGAGTERCSVASLVGRGCVQGWDGG